MQSSLRSSVGPLTSLAVLGLSLIAIAASCSVPEAELNESRTHNGDGDCFDDDRSGYETDIDCGGPDCDPCTGGKSCFDASDCAPPLDCVIRDADGEPRKVCATEHCFNHIQDEGETDVDCGGSECPACGVDQPCQAPEDCASLVCSSHVCAAPSCSDRTRNQDESDVDCGGTTCPGCGGGLRCTKNEHCLSDECAAGICNALCPQGTAECDNDPALQCETNLTTDERHCGSCDNVCALDHAVAVCSGASCSAIDGCDTGYDDCDGEVANGCEANLTSDANRCGECSQTCPSNNGEPSCVNGTCRISCDPGWVDCNEDALSDGCETKTSDDVENCGGCGKRCVPPDGETSWCKAGSCGSTLCPTGKGDCDGDGECTDDLASNAQSCGACGHRCVVVNGTPGCEAGTCVVAACNPGWGDCDLDASNGCEAKLTASLAHCGACGQACSIPNAVAACEAGQCVFKSCAPDRADCNDTEVDGCETDLTTDKAHCGTCETACSFANAHGSCVDSRCQLGPCDAGFGDCDGAAVTGCEAALATDPDHCGACGTVCLGAYVTERRCQGGACKPLCDPGAADCDGDPNTGCEPVNTLQSCGGCDVRCDLDHASESCATGTCALGVCEPGWDDCDDIAANGCETDTSTSTEHCGQCGSACALEHASAACEGGRCALVGCDAGYADCDGSVANGCESRLATDPANCGACGTTCSSSHVEARTCAAGVCDLACVLGYADFDGERIANGCELRLEYKLVNTNATDNQIGFAVRICNEGSAAAAIGDYVLKYWYSDETDTGSGPSNAGPTATQGTTPLAVTMNPTAAPATDHSHAIVITLAAESVAAGQCSQTISLSVSGTNGPNYAEANDFSHGSSTSFQAWGKVGLYAPGGSVLVLGTGF